MRRCALQNRSAANQAQQYHYNGDDQQNMDKATQRVGSDQAKQPQDDENNSNGVQHEKLLESLNQYDGTTRVCGQCHNRASLRYISLSVCALSRIQESKSHDHIVAFYKLLRQARRCC